MCHIVIEEDAEGDTIDVREYCSDSCARTDAHYAGWHGAQNAPSGSVCARCGTGLTDKKGNDDDDSCTLGR